MSGRRKALIIANDEYDQEALRNLLAPAADAEALGRVLGDRQIGDFTVQVVRNEPAHVIQAHIEEVFSESRSDDVLLLHFSGHGLKSESGELFFAASNTRPQRLGSTAVSAEFVQRCMQASRSRSVVLLLDCCYGGAFAQGVKVRAAGDVHVLDSFPRETRSGGGRGRAVITASSAMEFAFEGDHLGDDQHRRPSVFTNALVEGLATGDADRDEDGWVSLNELYDYVFDKVREENPHQTPSRQVQLEGELYLARSRRRRIRPAPLPPDLQAALADPNMYTRLGALGELRSRLASDNLPTAAGAYEALAELARNDIRAVADPAVAALNQAALQPVQTELHFGRIEQGSAPLHQQVQLLGPPIARACVPRPSHDWIRVDQTAEGLDVSVDTANTGTLHGSLDLKGPTGEAVIAIDAELVPPAAQTSATRVIRPADQGGTGPAISADQPERRSAAKGAQEAQQAVERAAAEQGGQGAAEATQPQAAEPHRDHGPTARESSPAPQLTTPAAPPAAWPPIRRGAAFAGIGIAFLAGVAGLISGFQFHDYYESGAHFFLNLAGSGVLVVVAVVALLQIRRLVIIGLLQGMLWLAAPFLAANIVLETHISAITSNAAVLFAVISGALGIIAAILLLVSWSPVAARRPASRIHALPVMLLGAVVLSQIAVLIFYVTLGKHAYSYYYAYHRIPLYSLYYYILGGAGALVVLAVTWYAMSLRARALGGALVLGWVTVTAIVLIAFITFWPAITGVGRVCGVLGCVLLATVVVLTINYVREPADLDASAN